MTTASIEKNFSRVTIREFIANVKALREREVVTISGTLSVKHTLDLLSAKNYLSCPVKASDSSEWLGFVDMMDILSFMIEECSQEKKLEMPGRGEVHWKSWCQNEELLRLRGSDLEQRDAESIINSSHCDPFCPVEDSGNMFQLVETLARVHRVAVRDTNGEISHIITQSAIIQFLNANIVVVGDLAKKTLKELGLVEGGVISMSEHAEAIVGFHTIKFNRVGGIAIVNTNNEYIGTLSASDLKGLTPEQFPSLLKPCRKYIEDRNGGVLPQPVVCSGDVTFFDAVHMLATKRVHRLWVLDALSHPVAVVTLSTIIRMLSVA
eukprot:c6348_g1_i1.p1 GENE.c6348_g1_i1~~c6348_g1_i1.p1  ORF type:complete len:322 (+),score=84.42 c6348_g1_i1:97-1062(+)